MLANKYNKALLNSPNDVIVHPDGSIWFTASRFGQTLAEGFANAPTQPGNTHEHLNNQLGSKIVDLIGLMTAQPAHTFCLTPNGHLKSVFSEEQVPYPNGQCFFT